MSWHVKTSEDKGRDRYKNNKLMFLHIDDKLLEKYQVTRTRIEDF